MEEDRYEIKPITFNDGDICIEDSIRFKGGSVKISTSGDTYTVELNCTTNNNKSVKAYYKGKIPVIMSNHFPPVKVHR